MLVCPAKTFRVESRWCLMAPDEYLFEADLPEHLPEADKQAILALEVGQSFLNEFSRFTRVQ